MSELARESRAQRRPQPTARSRTERLARLVCTAGLDRLVRLTWRGLLILNYHRIGIPGPSDDPDLFSCTAEEFEMHIQLLADRFPIVPAGAADLDLHRPARRVAITFDDGYRDQLQAASILRRHGLTGSFYICTGFVDEQRHAWWDEIATMTRDLDHDLPPSRFIPTGVEVQGRNAADVRRAVGAAYKRHAGDEGEPFLDWLSAVTGRDRSDPRTARRQWMSWPDVRELVALGMEVGAHTVSHPVLATLGAERQRVEIADSLVRLRTQLGVPIDTFAYPVGSRRAYDSSTMELLADLGVRRAFNFCGGTNSVRGRGPRNPYDISRAGVFGADTPDIVRAMSALPVIFARSSRYA